MLQIKNLAPNEDPTHLAMDAKGFLGRTADDDGGHRLLRDKDSGVSLQRPSPTGFEEADKSKCVLRELDKVVTTAAVAKRREVNSRERETGRAQTAPEVRKRSPAYPAARSGAEGEASVVFLRGASR